MKNDGTNIISRSRRDLSLLQPVKLDIVKDDFFTPIVPYVTHLNLEEKTVGIRLPNHLLPDRTLIESYFREDYEPKIWVEYIEVHGCFKDPSVFTYFANLIMQAFCKKYYFKYDISIVMPYS